jgi:hypothetical protein
MVMAAGWGPPRLTRTFVHSRPFAVKGGESLPISGGIGAVGAEIKERVEVKETAMIPRDIYDEMPDGAAKRQTNKQRLADLERDGAARRARIAQVIALEDLWHEVVQAHSTHLH